MTHAEIPSLQEETNTVRPDARDVSETPADMIGVRPVDVKTHTGEDRPCGVELGVDSPGANDGTGRHAVRSLASALGLLARKPMAAVPSEGGLHGRDLGGAARVELGAGLARVPTGRSGGRVLERGREAGNPFFELGDTRLQGA